MWIIDVYFILKWERKKKEKKRRVLKVVIGLINFISLFLLGD